MKLSILITFFVGAHLAIAAAPDRPVVPLWPNGAPGSEARKNEPEKTNASGSSVSNIHHPSMLVYLPPKDKATGCAVIVAPGGGHRNLAIRRWWSNVVGSVECGGKRDVQ